MVFDIIPYCYGTKHWYCNQYPCLKAYTCRDPEGTTFITVYVVGELFDGVAAITPHRCNMHHNPSHDHPRSHPQQPCRLACKYRESGYVIQYLPRHPCTHNLHDTTQSALVGGHQQAGQRPLKRAGRLDDVHVLDSTTGAKPWALMRSVVPVTLPEVGMT
jgi:hypothetical protein